MYHDHFRTNETYPDWLLGRSWASTKTCTPTFDGTWQERFEADKATVLGHLLTTSDIVYFTGHQNHRNLARWGHGRPHSR